MFPLLVDLGEVSLPLVGPVHLALPTYGVLFALAALAAGYWFVRRGRTLGVADEHLYNLCFYGLLGGIVGAKLTLILLDWRTYVEDPAELLGVIRAAGVLLGGVVVGAVAFIVYCRRHHLPLFRLGDAAAAPLALAQAVGRLGCFSAGCCWGVAVPGEHPLAVTFSDWRAHLQTGVPIGQPLFAIQLVQMAADLILAIVLTVLWRRRPDPPGTVFWIYLFLYCLTRGTLEFWRGDTARGLYFGELVSTSQVLCAVGLVLALAMLGRGHLGRRQPA